MDLFIPKSTLNAQMSEAACLTFLRKWVIRAAAPIPQDKVAGFVKFFRRKDRLKASKMFFAKLNYVIFLSNTAFHHAPPFSSC